MNNSIRWQSSTAALMAMAITTGTAIPMLSFNPVFAQGFNLNQLSANGAGVQNQNQEKKKKSCGC